MPYYVLSSAKLQKKKDNSRNISIFVLILLAIIKKKAYICNIL